LEEALVLSWTLHIAEALMHQPAPLLLEEGFKLPFLLDIGKEEKVNFHGIGIC